MIWEYYVLFRAKVASQCGEAKKELNKVGTLNGCLPYFDCYIQTNGQKLDEDREQMQQKESMPEVARYEFLLKIYGYQALEL